MENTLVEKSVFLQQKRKFFLNRIVTYFSFLLILLFISEIAKWNMIFQTICIITYQFFMVGQWYLLGKEVDHRFKIFYLNNSSFDRFLYRILMGNVVSIILFNLFSIAPQNIQSLLFWIFFSTVGLYYSWPTRGKIIEESIMGQFKEFRFLDSFEKNVLFLIGLFFFFSLPELPIFSNTEALKLYLDPKEQFSGQLWNFLNFLYYPLKSFPSLLNLAICVHFYVISLIFYLIALYATLRFFVSRRLSALGVFALLTTWSFSKILHYNFILIFKSSFLLIWIWATFWISRSATYRSGFFLGFINYLGVIIDPRHFFLYLIHIGLNYSFLHKEKLLWYKNQTFKYSILGLFFMLIAIFNHYEISWFSGDFNLINYGRDLGEYLKEKAFFSLSFIGIAMIVASFFKMKNIIFYKTVLPLENLFDLFCFIFPLFIFEVVLGLNLFYAFGLLWSLVLLSLLPLEWLFQSISRLRSKRNLIFVTYVLICLMDSRFEQRVRIVIKSLLENDYLTIF